MVSKGMLVGCRKPQSNTPTQISLQLRNTTMALGDGLGKSEPRI